MTTDEAVEFARGWIKAVRENPDKVGDVYPSRPPITYEILTQLVAAIDAVDPEPLNLPTRQPTPGVYGPGQGEEV